jgi:hypothetical protein
MHSKLIDGGKHLQQKDFFYFSQQKSSWFAVLFEYNQPQPAGNRQHLQMPNRFVLADF